MPAEKTSNKCNLPSFCFFGGEFRGPEPQAPSCNNNFLLYIRYTPQSWHLSDHRIKHQTNQSINGTAISSLLYKVHTIPTSTCPSRHRHISSSAESGANATPHCAVDICASRIVLCRFLQSRKITSLSRLCTE